MGIMDRIVNIFRANKHPEDNPKVEKRPIQLNVGDICDVSLVTYEVVGRIKMAGRTSSFLTLEDGGTIRYLHVEELGQTRIGIYTAIDGRMDTFDEVPTTMNHEGISYYLEENYSGTISINGKAPHAKSGELYIWQFQSDDRKLLRIEWQDGRFMLYEGESVLPADIKIVDRGN
jgi:hypothetical protein